MKYFYFQKTSEDIDPDQPTSTMAVSTPKKRKMFNNPKHGNIMSYIEHKEARDTLRSVANTMSLTLANAATVYTEGKEQLDAAAQQMAEIVEYFENTHLEGDTDED